MPVLIHHKTKELQKLCEAFQVKELYLFGSAVSGDFTDDSDLDFIVDFNRGGYDGAFDQFMDFKQQLEKLYGCQVDLYHQKKFRNPIFQQEVDSTKELIYAALKILLPTVMMSLMKQRYGTLPKTEFQSCLKKLEIIQHEASHSPLNFSQINLIKSGCILPKPIIFNIFTLSNRIINRR